MGEETDAWRVSSCAWHLLRVQDHLAATLGSCPPRNLMDSSELGEGPVSFTFILLALQAPGRHQDGDSGNFAPPLKGVL
jgi:hypothetical protein